MRHCFSNTVIAILGLCLISCSKGASEDAPSGDADRITIKISGIEYDMAFVKAGTFIMGAPDNDTAAVDTEKPAHTVTLTKDYYIGTTEVTQELYEIVMGENPSHFKGAKLPVDGVTYNKAMAFCDKLSQLTDYSFTLPTEGQWEYAARGGHKAPTTMTLYAGSNNIEEVAWFWDNSQISPNVGTTHPVATKTSNQLGLYDMSGNVWEWCLDWSDYYSTGLDIDPEGPLSGQYRVLRGGSWYNYAWRCRVTYRYNNYPDGDDHVHVIGFRIVTIDK